jgi:death on curing protein
VKEPKWLSPTLVAAIHDEAIYEFGGLRGVRDVGLLESAIARPRNRFVHVPKSTVFELAAALCVGLTKNHPFLDGDKRTALLATRAFLFLNGYTFEPDEADEVATMVALAASSLDEPAVAAWLTQNSARSK